MSYFNELPPKQDNFLLVIVMALIGLLALTVLLSGCSHTADWDKEAFSLEKVEHGGKVIRAWVPKERCEPFQVRQGDGASFACCFASTGKCHALPLFLSVDKVESTDE